MGQVDHRLEQLIKGLIKLWKLTNGHLLKSFLTYRGTCQQAEANILWDGLTIRITLIIYECYHEIETEEEESKAVHEYKRFNWRTNFQRKEAERGQWQAWLSSLVGFISSSFQQFYLEGFLTVFLGRLVNSFQTNILMGNL